MRRLFVWFAIAGLAIALPAWAAVGLPGEKAPLEAPAIAWPEGPGKVIVQQKCLFCHSGEYITGQRLTPAQWTAEVKKMVKFGSPLTHEEQVVLAAYLAKHYPAGQPRAEGVRVRLKPAAATP
ncbi:MAG: hypothetical protein ACK46X_20595 [Candidatus Sericytochromatia bacterium]